MTKGRTKYHNVQVTRGGKKYASIHEADRARELHLLERAGKISGMREQVRFEIIPAVRTAPGMGRYAEWEQEDAEAAFRAAIRQIREELRPILPIYRGVWGSRNHVRGSRIVERSAEYVADFVYFDEQGQLVVEDAKGVRTKDYILKRKLMLWVYGIRVKEV